MRATGARSKRAGCLSTSAGQFRRGPFKHSSDLAQPSRDGFTRLVPEVRNNLDLPDIHLEPVLQSVCGDGRARNWVGHPQSGTAPRLVDP
jgi:hypothetical protein